MDTNYEQLFKDCLFHLRCVSGSRNSFTPEMQDHMHKSEVRIPLRTETVEQMHRDAVSFLRVHDK